MWIINNKWIITSQFYYNKYTKTIGNLVKILSKYIELDSIISKKDKLVYILKFYF
jgi:hypothetical protein